MSKEMKGIALCWQCGDYNRKRHKCSIGCNKVTNEADGFFDECPLLNVIPCVIGRNITAMHPVDEFICSVCGFEMCHFVEQVRDEDAEDIYHREMEVKYCPNCGAKIDID